MLSAVSVTASRLRVVLTRGLARMGFREDSFLVVIAAIIGLVTAGAAVSFHELINGIRDLLYERIGPERLYGNWLVMVVVWPCLGGLVVGILSKYVFRTREGHGIVDVMESVIRSSGFIRPIAAIEKIITSAITIGTGGAVGAEGPIVQIGAAIASGTGQIFRLGRQQMPVIIGCGAAAGISAVFNSPMGGLLFALEVILQDFSIRNVTPVVVASVIANVATRGIFWRLLHSNFKAIFVIPPSTFEMDWTQVQNFILLGVACGLVGVALTRTMYFMDARFHRLRVPRAVRPAVGGALLGVMGVIYVLFFGHILLHQSKPIPFSSYPMPAFFGDGYGFIQLLLGGDFYKLWSSSYLLSLLAFLCIAKVLGTCITLSSGGSGGVIAPALFLGAVVGGGLGVLMRISGLYDASHVQPEAYALVGMAAVLAAIVHAPLASILILLELTRNPALVLPAMLATIIATGVARLIFADSIYTLTLRRRGINVGSATDSSLLHRLVVEQVDLDPAVLLRPREPFQRILDLMTRVGATDFVVVDDGGAYVGMVVAEDIKTALMEREAMPLLVVEELIRIEIPVVRNTDDLAKTMDTFAKHDVSHLPVALGQAPTKIIGLISRSGLMRSYQRALAGA